jgi:hypothetical protein
MAKLIPKKPVRPVMQDELRAKIQSGVLIRYLQQHADGTRPMEPTQIKAAEILLSKSLPSLQAVEINQVSNRDKMSESDILGRIQELMTRDPRLLQMLASKAAGNISDAVIIPAAPATPVPAPETPPAECVICGGEIRLDACMQCGQQVDADGQLI